MHADTDDDKPTMNRRPQLAEGERHEQEDRRSWVLGVLVELEGDGERFA